MLEPKIVSPACPKCGSIKKSGKLSCCARGGAWFKNCGDAGDPHFDHTWVEGIQACKKNVRSNLVNPPLIMFHHESNNGNPLNTSHQHTKIYYPTESLSDVDSMNSEDCVELSKLATYAFVLFISLHLQV
jgi:hypothetical protein